ncbi:MAG: mucoidy inhibitor MuiA family protein, partial [Candidatus Symbiothrix sp.]|nr:mucoidy inhibitor MuiA family protein [Candidatus Symbiothrix sp.]
MKTIFTVVIFICGIIFSASAQEPTNIELKTDISEVTVFIKGAQIVRKTMANIPVGRSSLRFVNLTPYADAKSVQVKLDRDVTVLSVNYQLNYNDTLRPSDELENLRKQNEALTQKIARTKTDKEVLNGQITFLTDNKQIGGSNTGVNLQNLQATYNYYSSQLSLLKTKELELDNSLKKLNEEKAALEKQMATFGNMKAEPTGEVLLTVESKTLQNAPAELIYFTSAAGWFPSYDIRAKSIDKPVELSYKANISQNTKELWKNVKLKVSSAEPDAGNVAPQLRTYVLDYYTAPPSYLSNTVLGNQVQGKVTDTSGEALIGVSVIVKGTTIGTFTDIEGNFALTLPSKGESLIFSYLGYKPLNKPLTSGYLNVILEEDQATLDEVVVVGYGLQNKQKRALTGAAKGISSITQKES